MNKKIALIVGAGPAGLTAAYELLQRTDVHPVIVETTDDIGGIAKTVSYKGNRIDIGGHRFFSKSDRIMRWWLNIFSLQGAPSKEDILLGRPGDCAFHAPYGGSKADPETTDNVMLVRKRLSRIFFLRRFFDYPVSLNANTVRNLGLTRIGKIVFSYARIRLFPVRPERSLEDFFINRFGRELYRTFFKDYTEKVWGVPCYHIKPEWGAQRIKGLSISKAVLHALRKAIRRDTTLVQKNVETSLIERFLYPKYGPGQLWEDVARRVKEKGGDIRLRHTAIEFMADGARIVAAKIRDEQTGRVSVIEADYFISTMPIRDLIRSLDKAASRHIRTIAEGLSYRDFITVGLLLKKLAIHNQTALKTINNIIPDNWIYIQERDVLVGRLQIFNNWSPYMVNDPDTVWIGLEYFCNEGDTLWQQPDPALVRLGISELAKIGIVREEDVLDSTVLRMRKTYPSYFGTYDQFDQIRRFTDQFENLFLIGRNGMHRYNNMDHSMLSAMTAVDNIMTGRADKDNIWAVNTEEEYHEEKEDRK